MKRKNVLILLLVFLFLLTPSCVLFVRALATSPFPERDKVSEVEMRFESSGGVKADGAMAMPILRKADTREVDLLYAILDSAERIPRWDLPEKCAAYRLAFRGENPEEVMTLYFGASDLSLYVLTSGKKLYRLAMPTATHRNTVLTPSAATFSLDGEFVSIYDYPEYANGPTGIAEISLSAWDIVTDFNFSGQNVSVNYTLYSARNAEPYETTDKTEIVPYDPDTVRMDVSAELSGGISVTLHYYLNVQE